jgi:hypothetical protein
MLRNLKRIWNPIDFQGQRSRSQGLIFRRGDMPHFALPLLKLHTVFTAINFVIYVNQAIHVGANFVKIWLFPVECYYIDWKSFPWVLFLPFFLWPWKSIGFQILLRFKYVPSLVKIHWRMLILVFTRMLRSKNLTRWHWPLTDFMWRNRTPFGKRVVNKYGSVCNNCWSFFHGSLHM